MSRVWQTILVALVLHGLIALPAWGQAPTTILLVRHAERAGDSTERDPELSESGRERAETLAHVLGEAGIAAIYSTPFRRTRDTARPLAERRGIEIIITPVNATFVEDMAATLRTAHPGAVVLVVGHSNTVPPLVNALGAGPFEDLDHDEYDDLFVVTLTADGRATAVRLRYGAPTS